MGVLLNGLGSPVGMETQIPAPAAQAQGWLNGLGSPVGIETTTSVRTRRNTARANWPGKPVRVGNQILALLQQLQNSYVGRAGAARSGWKIHERVGDFGGQR